MKVIGLANDKYICEINHTELEKFLNLYYGNQKRLKVGNEIDLGKGYDFSVDIQHTAKELERLVNGGDRVIRNIVEGITVLGKLSDG